MKKEPEKALFCVYRVKIAHPKIANRLKTLPVFLHQCAKGRKRTAYHFFTHAVGNADITRTAEIITRHDKKLVLLCALAEGVGTLWLISAFKQLLIPY